MAQAKCGWKNQKAVGVLVERSRSTKGQPTAADCGLIALGAVEGNTFQGEIKYMAEGPDFKISPDNAVEAGHKMTITFAPQSATLTDGDVVEAGCPDHPGLFGRYTKDRKP